MSITLPDDLVRRLDEVGTNRSAVLEGAARAFLAPLDIEQRDSRDLKIINRNATRLNRHATDTRGYQTLQ